jgi:hypothetical protein
MKRWLLGSVMMAAALAAVGCEETASAPAKTSDAATGDAAADTATPPGETGCDALCTAYKDAGCGSVTDLSFGDCVKECEDTNALVNDGAHTQACIDEYEAFKACMTSTTLACNGFDVAKGSCRADYDHYYNYCQGIATPESPCITNDAWNAFCASTAATPVGKVCQGDAEPGCVMGGNDNNADLYCCP